MIGRESPLLPHTTRFISNWESEVGGGGGVMNSRLADDVKGGEP
jgi:hypothetical protein